MSSKSYSSTTTTLKDVRTDLSQAQAGQIAAPGAVIANPGAIGMSAGDYGNVSLSVAGGFKSGMSGAEVKDLLGQQASLAQQTVTKVADFAKSSIAATTAAKTGELTDWQRYIPYMIGGLVLVVILKARR
jgi:hypothetical protein